MPESKVRPIAGALPSSQTPASRVMGLFVQAQVPAPEDWENYLVLLLIDGNRFFWQPLKFQNAYADVVLRLRGSGRLTQTEANPALTPEGRVWMERFSASYL